MLRGKSHCLAQVIRRVSENFDTFSAKDFVEISTDNYKFSAKIGDNCILLKDGGVGTIEFVDKEASIFFIGILYFLLFNRKESFFNFPVNSCKLNIFRVSKPTLRSIPVSQISVARKCVLLPLELDSFVSFPM